MIPNHPQFLQALNEKRKVRVQFYSKPDSGVLDRICAPLDYGMRGEAKDGLNRYWLWDYAGGTGGCPLGLLSQQIVDLKVLGEEFDPAQLTGGPAPQPVSPVEDVPPAVAVPTGPPTSPMS
jgi:hypothetical protein